MYNQFGVQKRLVCKKWDQVIRGHVPTLLVLGRSGVKGYNTELWNDIMEDLTDRPWKCVNALAIREFTPRIRHTWQPLLETPIMQLVNSDHLIFLDLSGSMPTKSVLMGSCHHYKNVLFTHDVMVSTILNIQPLKHAKNLRHAVLNYRRIKGLEDLLLAPNLIQLGIIYIYVCVCALFFVFFQCQLRT